MAAQNGQPNTNNAPGGPDAVTQVSSMPLPPMHYVNEYTDEAIRRGTAPLPPPPILDTYSMFGQPFSSEDCIVASLESQGIRRLYSAKEVDRKRELRKLNHSALVNFLDLLDILIKTPDSQKREEKIEDLNLIFIHMHHLVNEFRPHQARETLRVMLHVQKKRRLLVSEKFAEVLEKVKEQIRNGLEALPDVDRDEIHHNSEDFLGDRRHLLSSNSSNDDYADFSFIDSAMCGVSDIYNV